MRQSKARVISDGAVAGLIGAAVIALWFLIFDAARGQPLETPAMLAAVMFHSVYNPAINSVAWGLVAAYTLLHFAAFALIGIIGALLLDAAEGAPELFGTLFVFVIAFEVFFIAVLMLLGPSAAVALPWWKVIIGNLMATAVMLGYFLWRQPALAQNLFGPWIEVVREGVTAGVIGAVIVAAWFLIYDFIAGQPFHTPELLGSALFQSVGVEHSGMVMTAVVLGYTALHFFAFIMFGIAASVMIVASEREPLLAFGALIIALWFELCFVAFVTVLDQSALEAIGWWQILAGNVIAMAAIFAFYERRHPGILARISERWARTRDEGGASGAARVRDRPA